MTITAKSFNVFATGLSVLHNYFDGPDKVIFQLNQITANAVKARCWCSI